jgi:hypothetical protein
MPAANDPWWIHVIRGPWLKRQIGAKPPSALSRHRYLNQPLATTPDVSLTGFQNGSSSPVQVRVSLREAHLEIWRSKYY